LSGPKSRPCTDPAAVPQRLWMRAGRGARPRLAAVVLSVCLRACSGPAQAATINPTCQLAAAAPCPVAGQQCVYNAFLSRRVCSCATGGGYLAGENCRESCPIVDTSKFQGSPPGSPAAHAARRPIHTPLPPRPSPWPSCAPPRRAAPVRLTPAPARRAAGARAHCATLRATIPRASATTRRACANARLAS